MVTWDSSKSQQIYQQPFKFNEFKNHEKTTCTFINIACRFFLVCCGYAPHKYTSLSLCNSLLDGISLLLLQNKNLESLEISEFSSSLSLFDLLSPCALGPLLFDWSPFLGNDSRTWASGKLLDNLGSQSDLTERNGLSRNTWFRAINKNLDS